MKLGLVIVLALVGCKPAETPKQYPAYCADEKLFTAAVLRCTDKSDTREASQACKRDLQASCGFVETVSKGAK